METKYVRKLKPSFPTILTAPILFTFVALTGCGQFSPTSPVAPVVSSTGTTGAPPPSSTPGTVYIPIPAPPVSPTPAPTTVTLSTVIAREMQPVDLQFLSDYNINKLTLPPGSDFDSSLHKFLWLTKAGQAGNYVVEFAASGNRTVRIPMTITPISPDQIAKGPTDGFQDGDVGYVFVHGAGDLDRCSNARDLAAYWQLSPSLIGRAAGSSTLACYDSRSRAEDVAAGVAKQILNANCGRFNKCIVITHSMGGLVIEHMFTHTRAAASSDMEPALFKNAELYQQVKDRTLSVISLASAAGGSRVADIVIDPGNKAVFQTIVGTVSQWFGSDNGSTKSVTTRRASDTLAPFGWDPGVPIYMVPGYTVRTVGEQDDAVAGFLNSIIGNISLNVYQGDSDLAKLDTIVQFDSRPDGLVDFRSSCGIASDNPHDGPGYSASLAIQLSYCFNAKHKPNHYVWFLSNLNHYLISTKWNDCHNSKNPCTIRDPDAANQTFSLNSSYKYLSAVEAIRAKLDVNRLGNTTVAITYK